MSMRQQALNQFKVYFDGGDSREWAYGSWKIEFNGFEKLVYKFKVEPLETTWVSDQWGEFMGQSPLRATSNIAEYVSLIKALEWLQSVKEKELYEVKIMGDSMLVVSQMNQTWRTRKPHLKDFRDRALDLLKDFGKWTAIWHPRFVSVSIFGH